MSYDVFISYNVADRFIAEAVCHYIEERRLRCFIAPRDISDPDWAGCITQAIENSKAFVVVVSENSIMSNEVAKEIALATRVSNFIFPFRIDDSELDGRMTYHLSAFHWIDAVTPPIEKRLNELADRITASLSGQVENLTLGNLSGSRNQSRQNLLGQAVRPRAEFLGREKELQQLHELFTSGVNAVFLTGMGGIGKSEIAKAYANANRSAYPCVVLATFETDLLHLIANDQSIPVENLQQASATGGQGETLEEYYVRKMRALRSIVSENTLIIIDNFDVEWDPQLDEVMRLPCKLLFTTRTDFSSYGYETVKVGPLENMEDLERIIGKIDRTYTADEDRTAIRDIICLLDCHTYAVSLTAAQMKAGRIKPVKMLSQLKQEGLNIQTRSGFAREAGTRKATAYEYIQALFDFTGLDKAACDVLRYLACLSRDGVGIDLFMECCGIDDFGAISRLADLNWIQLDEDHDRISLHMLVRELVWERLRPDLENCRPLLQGAHTWATNAWNKSHEENCSHNAVIFSLLETFREPTVELVDCFEEYATFAWIQGRFDLAEQCEHKLYALCAQHYGEISVRAGDQALRVAAVYYNQGDYAKACPWYEKGLRIQETIDPESLGAYVARSKVARSNAQNGDYALAKAQQFQNLDFIQRYHAEILESGVGGETLRKANIQLASARMFAARILCSLNAFEEGLPLAQLSYEYLKTDTVEPSLVIYAMMVLAYVHHGLKNYAQALDYARQALEGNNHYHGKNRIDAMFLHEMQGDLLALQGQYEQAERSYALALGGREKLYSADVDSITRLEEKMTGVRQGTFVQTQLQGFWP